MKAILHPRGGALLFVLIFSSSLAACAFFFLLMLQTSHTASRVRISSDMLHACVESATHHARALLYADLTAGPADTFDDIWAKAPRHEPFPSRYAWLRYRAAFTNLAAQRWFEFPGPLPDTVVRYRFALVDAPLGSTAPPAVWHDDRWVPTDDINAADLTRLTDLVRTFDAAATNPAWLARAVAALADARDANHALLDPTIPDTEALRFETTHLGAEQRWVHFDDTLRLGRYYEERASHNFFLIAEARPYYNQELGRTNIAVTLDDQPHSFVAGWEAYRDLRARYALPRWYPGLWVGVTAATGAGLPEPWGTFKYQPVISNTTDTLFFDDANLARYSPLGQWRQTVTFASWFSSLNELTRGDLPQVRHRGALVTTSPAAADTIILTNFTPRNVYSLTLLCGARLSHAYEASISINPRAPAQPVTFLTDGTALFANGQPLLLDALHPGLAELVIRAPHHGVSPTAPFFLESALLQQPEFVTLRNHSLAPISLYGWRFGYRFGEHLFWSAPFTSAVRYSPRLHGPETNALPTVAPNQRLIITPSACLYDWWYGVTRNGMWGDVPEENEPLIELGWLGWGPAFRVRELEVLREHRMPGSSNREFVWETEWRARAPHVFAIRDVHKLVGVPVALEPAKQSDPAPVYGEITGVDHGALIIRCAGTRARLAHWRHAMVHLLSIPRTPAEMWLLVPEGQPAAVLCPQQPPAPSSVVCNTTFASTRQRIATLASIGISRSADWFVPVALFRPFDATACVVATSLDFTPGWARIVSSQRTTWSFDARFTRFPSGAPGPFYATVHLSTNLSLPVRAISDGLLELRAPPYATPRAMRDRIVFLSPSPYSPGLHLFGQPGWIDCAWHDIPPIHTPVHLTLAGRAAPPPMPPPDSPLAWHLRTNSLPRFSVAAWDFHRAQFVTLASNVTFDASDRLHVGLLPPSMISHGTLRICLFTHDRLAPNAASLWLDGIYLHPWRPYTSINVNTASRRSLAPFFPDATSVVRVTQATPRGGYASLSQLLHTAPELDDCTPNQTAALSVCSDVFDLCLEVAILRRHANGDELLAHTFARRRLDRSPCRLNPLAPARLLPSSLP